MRVYICMCMFKISTHRHDSYFVYVCYLMCKLMTVICGISRHVSARVNMEMLLIAVDIAVRLACCCCTHVTGEALNIIML